MKVFVFGNKDVDEDRVAFVVAKKLQKKFRDVEFIEVNPGEDLPFANDPEVTILDGIDGIKKVTLLTERDLNTIIAPESVSVHDFDLGFQLKYLHKLGKLGKINIIGVPKKGKIAYLHVSAILKSLLLHSSQNP